MEEIKDSRKSIFEPEPTRRKLSKLDKLLLVWLVPMGFRSVLATADYLISDRFCDLLDKYASPALEYLGKLTY